jgi:aryl-alcohol dehydrogenase-like predicted oxidoreductase
MASSIARSARAAAAGVGSARDRWEAAKLHDLLDEGMSRHEFILRFTLSHPGVSSAIVGTSKPGHLRGNVQAASRGPLPQDVYAEARRRLAAA